MVQASTARLITHEMGHAVLGLSDFSITNNNVPFTDSIITPIKGTMRGRYSNQCKYGLFSKC